MTRTGSKYSEWKSRVNVRDNFKCVKCGRDGKEAHHKKSWKEFPELRFDVSNGETLCLDCHKKCRGTGRPKIKDGKVVTFYLSFSTIEKLRKDAFEKKKSMSQYVEELIDGENNG